MTANTTTSSPLISIIMPVRNAEYYIIECINSLAIQTYQNFQLLILDDGSTDRTQDLISSKTKDFHWIKLVSRRDNLPYGLVNTLNFLVSQVNTPFLARMDADDIAMPNRLEQQLYAIKKYKYDIICGNYYIRDEISKKTPYLAYPNYKNLELQDEFLSTNPVCHPIIFGRTELFKMHAYHHVTAAEDLELWIRMRKNGVSFFWLSIPYLILRIHSSNTSKLKFFEQKQNAAKAHQDFCINYRKITPPQSFIDYLPGIGFSTIKNDLEIIHFLQWWNSIIFKKCKFSIRLIAASPIFDVLNQRVKSKGKLSLLFLSLRSTTIILSLVFALLAKIEILSLRFIGKFRSNFSS